jgi:tryptophan synthase alpha chain
VRALLEHDGDDAAARRALAAVAEDLRDGVERART